MSDLRAAKNELNNLYQQFDQQDTPIERLRQALYLVIEHLEELEKHGINTVLPR